LSRKFSHAIGSVVIEFCGAVLDLLLIFLKGSLREPFKKINNRFETLPNFALLWLEQKRT
jgi:hypothetical protein